jgi:hypothetical protein
MSFLSTSCKIFHFSFLAMSKNRFLAMSFLAMYGHRLVNMKKLHISNAQNWLQTSAGTFKWPKQKSETCVV